MLQGTFPRKGFSYEASVASARLPTVLTVGGQVQRPVTVADTGALRKQELTSVLLNLSVPLFIHKWKYPPRKIVA